MLFFVGVLPALLVVPIVFVLQEPDVVAQGAKAEPRPAQQREGLWGRRSSSSATPRWRRNTLVGVFLGVSGMIGLWGIGFFSPELISTALAGAPQGEVDRVRGWGTALQDVGAFSRHDRLHGWSASLVSRRLAFLGAFLLSMVVTMFVFNSLQTASDAYWMLPMMGFAQLSVFAGYSIYFPELFPTRLRGTGVGFCYNTVRYLAAPAPILFGYLATMMSFRTAAILMSTVYLVGVVALIWAPETKGQGAA